MIIMKVYINVYDILVPRYNQGLSTVGMGIFHTGVEVGGAEYAYGGNSLVATTGVYEMEPRCHDVFRFREQREAGVCDESIIDDLLRKLMKRFRANRYDMLVFNCNHFSDELLRGLTGRGLPPDLNRAATIGSYVHCVVPRRYLIVTPPGAKETEMTWDLKTAGKGVKGISSDEDDGLLATKVTEKA